MVHRLQFQTARLSPLHGPWLSPLQDRWEVHRLQFQTARLSPIHGPWPSPLNERWEATSPAVPKCATLSPLRITPSQTISASGLPSQGVHNASVPNDLRPRPRDPESTPFVGLSFFRPGKTVRVAPLPLELYSNRQARHPPPRRIQSSPSGRGIDVAACAPTVQAAGHIHPGPSTRASRHPLTCSIHSEVLTPETMLPAPQGHWEPRSDHTLHWFAQKRLLVRAQTLQAAGHVHLWALQVGPLARHVCAGRPHY